MNLTSSPWIPAYKAGAHQHLSLFEVFEDLEQIDDLDLLPHERISVYSLLLAIAQQALRQELSTYEGWLGCRDDIGKAAVTYLQQPEIRAGFELFGEGQRFLQIHGHGTPGNVPVSKLSFVDDAGTLLFQPGLVADMRDQKAQEADLALRVLTFQNYGAGGKIGGSEIAAGKKTATPVSAKAGPRRHDNSVHTYLRGDTLGETLWLNLFCEEALEGAKLGRPVWEIITETGATDIADLSKAHRKELTESYLGRLVPLSRSLWLSSDLKSTEITIALDYGGYAEGFLDPTQTELLIEPKNKPAVRTVLGSAKGGTIQQVWRQIPAILVAEKDGDHGRSAPMALANIAASEGQTDLWLGSLAGNQASVIALIESSYRLPTVDQSGSHEWSKIFQVGVTEADRSHQALRTQVYRWCVATQGTLKNANPESFKRFTEGRQDLATRRYWARLERAVQNLIDDAVLALERPDKALPRSRKEDGAKWLPTVWSSVEIAFNATCPCLTNSDARAVAIVRTTIKTYQSPKFMKIDAQKPELKLGWLKRTCREMNNGKPNSKFNAGIRAELRRGLRRNEPSLVPLLQAAGWDSDESPFQKDAYRIVAALFAEHPNLGEPRKKDDDRGAVERINFGQLCRQFALSQQNTKNAVEHQSRGSGSTNPFVSRFERLLACRTPESMIPHLSGISRMIGAMKQTPTINWFQLHQDLLWWEKTWPDSDGVRMRWATAFWSEAPKKTTEAETEETSE